MSDKPIRVLHVFHMMGNGGVEHFVMNYYRKIDRSRVQFDFLTSVEDAGFFDDEIKALGGKLYHAYPIKKNPLRNFYDIVRIIHENKYQIVHRHTGNAIGYYDLHAAKLGGAKNLILHSHSTEAETPLLHTLSKALLKMKCIHLACSRTAADFLFGKKSECKIIPNSINTKQYEFSLENRARIRNELGLLPETFVMGHVGRFGPAKNHHKLFEIFKAVNNTNPNSVLVCVGEGELMDECKEYAENLGISNSILYLGNRPDASRVYSAMDAYVLPSFNEGFGITLLEAQANGLTCFASADVVPKETNVTGNVHFINLHESAEIWAQNIIEYSKRHSNAADIIHNTVYDLDTSVEVLTHYYETLGE